jgi:hypothetical protein
MVKKSSGDIEGLFRSFGRDSGGYRELAREADAEAAQRRWPMLGGIAPEAGERPAALDADSKREWREHRGAGDEPVMPAPQPSVEGKRLVGGLDNLLRRGDGAPMAAPAERPRPGRAVAPQAERAPQVDEAAPRGRMLQRSEDAPRPAAKPAREKRGLFGGLARDAAGRSGGGSLSSVFSRLEGDSRGAKRLGPGRLRKR